MPDIRETLAQLDQRLADLRHQIAGLADAPAPSPPAPPPAHRPLPMPALPDPEDGRAGEFAPVVPPRARGDAQGRAMAQEVGELGAQIEQLLTLRERLLVDARELLRRYELQLDELERHDSSDVQAALASLLSGQGAAAEPAVGPEVLASRPAFFAGRVTVTVAGASRIQTVEVLEDSLSRVPHVQEVYIRRWHAGALWLELTVSEGVELIGELNRVLPFPFAVQSATGQEVIISLEGER